MVDGIGLDKFAWSSWLRAAGVVSFDAGLPCAIEAVVTAENPPNTTQTNCDPKGNCEVVPHHLSAALKLAAYRQHQCNGLV